MFLIRPLVMLVWTPPNVSFMHKWPATSLLNTTMKTGYNCTSTYLSNVCSRLLPVVPSSPVICWFSSWRDSTWILSWVSSTSFPCSASVLICRSLRVDCSSSDNVRCCSPNSECRVWYFFFSAASLSILNWRLVSESEWWRNFASFSYNKKHMVPCSCLSVIHRYVGQSHTTTNCQYRFSTPSREGTEVPV